jgi:Fur family ferric uptake transcriptional regulator
VKDANIESGIQKRRRLLREAGLRATAARIAVLDALQHSERPLSHAEVVAVLDERPFDQATVYRNLVDLVRAGLATRSDLGDRIWRFAAGSEHHTSDQHPHFVCTECGRVQCLPGTRVSFASARGGPRALARDEVEIQIRGRCDMCRTGGAR